MDGCLIGDNLIFMAQIAGAVLAALLTRDALHWLITSW
jgi:hypothetical protein